ncbi:hypothetical protein K3495_g12459 [Podosphaera aphanis]|nr:hypothetical protein K3495_g12459 [Podosphaera aphanis]
MAGPGGGPPRRSNNCTKHKCRCPYNDNDETIISDINTDTPEFQQTVNQAALSRVNPPSSLSIPDDRLLHHIHSVSNQLIHLHGSNFTVWSHYVPLFIKIGVDHAFVMHALLALSATHQNWETGCSLSAYRAYEHRAAAIVGLHKALDSFSQQNSDAALAASLILSWQENDWFAWTRLSLGTLVEHNVFISPNQLSDNPLSVNPLSANYMPYKTPTDASRPHIPSPKFGESLLSPASSSFEEGQSFSVSKQEDNIGFYDGQNLSRNFAGSTLDNREPRSFEIESVHLGLAEELPESREIPIESQPQLSEPIEFAAFARKGKDRQD